MKRLGLGYGIAQQGSKLNYDYIKHLTDLFSDNIVAYWPLNEKEGTTATDVVNGYNAAYDGVKLNKPGIFRGQKSSQFDNLEDDIRIAYSSAWSAAFPKSEGSIMLWFDPSDDYFTSGKRTFFNLRLGSYYLRLYKGAKNSISLLKTQSIGTELKTKYYLHLDAPQLLTVVWSVSGNYVRFYRNSVLLSEITGIEPFESIWNQTYSAIGNEGTGYSYSCMGYMSHVILLDKVVNQTEMENAMYLKKAFLLFEGDSRFSTFLPPEYAVGQLHSSYNKYYIHDNKAVAGSVVSDLVSRQASDIALMRNGLRNILVVLIGYNDAKNGGVSMVTLYTHIANYCSYMKSAGFEVALCTEIDGSSNYGGWSDDYLVLNEMLKADYSFANYLIDLGADSRLQDHTNTTYFIDGVHPTPLGAEVIGGIIAETLNLV